MWNVRGQVIPSVITTLGAIPKMFEKRLKDIGITTEIGQFQKTVMLVMERILKFLEMYRY